MNKPYLTVLLCLAGTVAAAQTTTPETAAAGFSNMEIMVIVMLVFMLMVVAAVYLMLKVIRLLYVEKTAPDTVPVLKSKRHWEDVEPEGPSMWEKLLSLKPIAEEKNIALPHTYDNITELNNPVPSWFNVLFYGTIIFGVGYLIIYQFTDMGPSQQQEYVQEVAKADADKLAAIKKSGIVIDENTVKVDRTAPTLENGRMVFSNNCIACHGDKAQGLVGPNLTDDYWLHGGGINNVFKTIKYGVPDKGMVPWGKTMSPKNISDIANYLLSIRGTNPVNGKAPQGTLYVEDKADMKTGNEKGGK